MLTRVVHMWSTPLDRKLCPYELVDGRQRDCQAQAKPTLRASPTDPSRTRRWHTAELGKGDSFTIYHFCCPAAIAAEYQSKSASGNIIKPQISCFGSDTAIPWIVAVAAMDGIHLQYIFYHPNNATTKNKLQDRRPIFLALSSTMPSRAMIRYKRIYNFLCSMLILCILLHVLHTLYSIFIHFWVLTY